MEIKIDKKIIGKGHPCFLIAEAGVNHKLVGDASQQSLGRACEMVNIAKRAGCDAIKFQTFKAEKLQLKNIPKPGYQNRNLGRDVDYFNILKSLETSQEDQIKIAKYCQSKGIIFLSTPYDNDSANFLENLDVPAFKIASIELTNHLFLRYVAKKNKPVFLSTGLSDLEKVKKAVAVFDSEGMKNNLMIFQCTSNYPTEYEDINLRVLTRYSQEFGLIYGLSDHSRDDIASIGAVALGGLILEKHFTLDKNFPGPDHSASLNPDEVKQWVKHVREMENFIKNNNGEIGENILNTFVEKVNYINLQDMEKCLGSAEKQITETEIDNKQMMKFLVIKSAKAGTTIGYKHLRAMRTGGEGILALDENLEKIVGRELKKTIDKPRAFTWNMIE